MTVVFPRCPRGTVVTPRLVRVGGDLVSSLGGPTQRITRVGTRYAVEVELPTLDAACAARWLACPLAADTSGDTLALIMPQTLDVTAMAGVTGTGAVGTSEIVYTGPVPEVGMWLSFRVGGRHYLHQVTELIATGRMRVAPLLRVAIPAVTPLDFLTPKLEGFPDDTSWSVEFFRFIGHTFTLTESA
jgi:hypothetical protein